MDPDYLDALVDKADEMRKREKEEVLDKRDAQKQKPYRAPYDPQTDWPERYHGNKPWRPI